MGDSYWSENTNYICTDNFTLDEVNLLVTALEQNFGLVCGVNKRLQPNKKICYRIRFSSKVDNINNLKNLVKPHFIPSLLYKLNLGKD